MPFQTLSNFHCAGSSVADPGCLSRIPDPDYLIQEPTKKRRGEKSITFFSLQLLHSRQLKHDHNPSSSSFIIASRPSNIFDIMTVTLSQCIFFYIHSTLYNPKWKKNWIEETISPSPVGWGIVLFPIKRNATHWTQSWTQFLDSFYTFRWP
jgi:hypothetical protein